MKSNNTNKDSARINAARLIVENSLEIPEIAEALLKYGYDSEKLNEGKSLLKRVVRRFLTINRDSESEQLPERKRISLRIWLQYHAIASNAERHFLLDAEFYRCGDHNSAVPFGSFWAV